MMLATVDSGSILLKFDALQSQSWNFRALFEKRKCDVCNFHVQINQLRAEMDVAMCTLRTDGGNPSYILLFRSVAVILLTF